MRKDAEGVASVSAVPGGKNAETDGQEAESMRDFLT
jgi:hypothetical protein